MSKAIGGSLPLAVIAYDQDLDVWSPGAHTGTFRGNTLAMATGTATLAVRRPRTSSTPAPRRSAAHDDARCGSSRPGPASVTSAVAG